MNTLDALDAQMLRSDIPAFRPGDTLKVHVKVIEGTRSRVQIFQGVVIRRHGAGARETFTVRKVSFGVGVERTFPVHSPNLDKIEVFTRGDVFLRIGFHFGNGLLGHQFSFFLRRFCFGRFHRFGRCHISLFTWRRGRLARCNQHKSRHRCQGFFHSETPIR